MPTATVRIIKGAPEETELAAVIAVLHQVLARPATSQSAGASGMAAARTGRPRRATWTRPPRRSGPTWDEALEHHER